MRTVGQEPRAVFVPSSVLADRERMRCAHSVAATLLTVRAHGAETWGWQGRTLSRRADDRWLRVVGRPEGKDGGRTWDGNASADALLPRSVPRPRLYDVAEWAAGAHVYRAELSEFVPRPALNAGGPVLWNELDLPASWWSDLRGALATTAAVPTDRRAVRQQWIDRHFARLLGIPAPSITAWTTGHGDLHFGNLIGPPLAIVDWEGWGRMPAGFDVGLLHAYSLTAPATAARIRTTFPEIFESPGGRVGELVALAQLLQVTERGGHPELAPHLITRAEQLTGVPVPKQPAAASRTALLAQVPSIHTQDGGMT